MNSETSYRHILLYSLPIIGVTLVEPMAELVDTFFMGRLGPSELAALSATSIVLSVSVWIFNFLIHVSSVQIAGLFGAGKQSELQGSIRISLMISLGVGILVTLSLQMIKHFVFGHWMQLETGTLNLALEYFDIRMVGLWMLFLNVGLAGIFRGLQRIRLALVLVIIQTALNIPSTWLLVFPFELGMQGAAIGTVISQAVSCLIGLFILFKYHIENPFSGWMQNLTSGFAQYSKGSTNQFLRTVALSGSLFLSASLANREGTVTAAAYQITMQLWLLNAYILDGFAGTAASLGAKLLGEKRHSDWLTLSHRLLILSGVCGLLFALFYGFFPDAVKIFTISEPVVEAVLSVWWLVVLAQIPNSLAFAMDGIFFGLNRFATVRKVMWEGVLLAYGPTLYLLWNGMDHRLTALWAAALILNFYRLGRLSYTFGKERKGQPLSGSSNLET